MRTERRWADFGIEAPDHGTGNYRTICPKCAPTRKKKNVKSLSVELDEGVWHCFHCEWSGTLKGGQDNDPDTQWWKDEDRPKTYTKPKPKTREETDPANDARRKWAAIMQARGITPDVIKANGVDVRNVWFPQIEGEDYGLAYPYYRKGELINVKYRHADKHFRMEKDAEQIFWRLDEIAKPELETVIITEGECLTGETEVLTPEGWIRLDAYAGEQVTQVAEGGTLTLVQPSAYIAKPYTGDLLRRTNHQRFQITTTPEHRMVAIDRHGAWRIHRAEQPLSRADHIPRTGGMDGAGIPLSEDQIALCLAISADAAIRAPKEDVQRITKMRQVERYAVCSFRKDRKIQRLRGILSRLGIAASDRAIKRGYQSICFHFPDWVPGRLLPHEWLTLASSSQREFMLKEMVEWDGNRVVGRDQDEYSSKHDNNAVFMQTLAHTTGRISTIMDRTNEWGSWFKISILHGKSTTSWQSLQTEAIAYQGMVYCVTVPTGMILIRDGRCISVTGNSDALAVEVAGFKNATSVPGGAPNPDAKSYGTKFAFMEDEYTAEVLASKKWFILATDDDPPGHKLRDELARMLDPARCKTVVWPEGCKDANDVLQRHGAGALAGCINGAKRIPIEGVISLPQFRDQMDIVYVNGFPPGPSTGWNNLDRDMYGNPLYRPADGLLTFITGVPGSGKSRFVNALLINLARNEGKRFGVCSPEYQPTELLVKHLAETYIGKTMDPGAENRMSVTEYEEAMEFVGEHFHFIVPKTTSPEEILDKTSALIGRYGIRGLLIDPLTEVDIPNAQGQNDVKALQEMLGTVQRFNRRQGMHVWINAHPTKMRDDDDTGQPKVPNMYDINGGAQFANKADFILAVNRDKTSQSGETTIYVRKARFQHLGSYGEATLIFDKVTGRYRDAPRSTPESENWIMSKPKEPWEESYYDNG